MSLRTGVYTPSLLSAWGETMAQPVLSMEVMESMEVSHCHYRLKLDSIHVQSISQVEAVPSAWAIFWPAILTLESMVICWWRESPRPQPPFSWQPTLPSLPEERSVTWPEVDILTQENRKQHHSPIMDCFLASCPTGFRVRKAMKVRTKRRQ